ncbi:ankyrin, partial [Armillaria gallica]
MVQEIVAFLDSACCRKVAKIFHAAELSTKVPVPLHIAVEYGLLHITEVLLDQGDGPCQCMTPLLVTAIKRQNLEIIKLLLHQDNIDPNTQSSWQQWTPLFYAAEEGSTQVVEILLQSDHVNVNVNCKDFRGRTPLMTVVISGDISMAEVLLKHAQVDKLARDNEDNTAYSHAYWQFHQ